MGERFFQDWRTTLAGIPVGLFIYWGSVVLYTLGVRWAIRRFPDQEQSSRRMVAIVVVVGLIMVATSIFDVWLYSIVPYTGVEFTWAVLGPLLVFGCVFTAGLSVVLGLFHIYGQWQDRQVELEQLKQQAIQHKIDVLKGQVNPHFLFNSLSSISALIADDPHRAEAFVDDLSRVYRYMLQANKSQLVSLTDELAFIRTYTNLLTLRYGDRLRIEVPPGSATDGFLVPLSLQILVDNAIKHNGMSDQKPLIIRILVATETVLVVNTMQPKTVLVNPNPGQLANLMASYARLSDVGVVAETTGDLFCVRLPLLQTVDA